MTYVDGFVIPISKNKITAYKKMALIGAKAWMRHGALQYWECFGEELKVTDPATGNKAAPFAKKFGLKPGETVLFSWIVFKNKAHRNKVNAKVMKDMEKEMAGFDKDKMPFDMEKVLYGGFKPIVQRQQ